jgi:hypothetical protein
VATDKFLEFSKIDRSPALAAREFLRPHAVEKHAELALADVDVGKPVVFFDGKTHWLGDGSHRIAGAEKAGHKGAQVEIREGGFDEAFRFACSANDAHGVETSAGDKRARAAHLWLRRKDENPRPSDRVIGIGANVSTELARLVRLDLERDGQLPTVGSSVGADGKVRTTTPKREEPANRLSGVEDAMVPVSSLIPGKVTNGKADEAIREPARTQEPAWVETDEDREPVLTDADWDAAEADEAVTAAADRVRKKIAAAVREVDAFAEAYGRKGGGAHQQTISALDAALCRFGVLQVEATPLGAAT